MPIVVTDNKLHEQAFIHAWIEVYKTDSHLDVEIMRYLPTALNVKVKKFSPARANGGGHVFCQVLPNVSCICLASLHAAAGTAAVPMSYGLAVIVHTQMAMRECLVIVANFVSCM